MDELSGTYPSSTEKKKCCVFCFVFAVWFVLAALELDDSWILRMVPGHTRNQLPLSSWWTQHRIKKNVRKDHFGALKFGARNEHLGNFSVIALCCFLSILPLALLLHGFGCSLHHLKRILWTLDVAVRCFTLFHKNLDWLSCLALSNFKAFVSSSDTMTWLKVFRRTFWPLSCVFLCDVVNLHSQWCSCPCLLDARYSVTGIYPMTMLSVWTSSPLVLGMVFSSLTVSTAEDS